VTAAAPDTAREAVYVFGVVETSAVDTADVDLPDDVEIVSDGPVAAVVGAVSADRALGLASDLRRHDAVVAGFVARGIAILPMRFGSTVAAPATLVGEVLAPKREAFLAALRELDGLVQYTVRVGYVREAVLSAVMRNDPRIARLRAEARGQSAQIRLGELVVQAIDRRRTGDAERLQSELEPLVERVDCQLSQDPDRLADFACLVTRDRGVEFEQSLEGIAKRHHGAVRMTLLGPLAPYDFVPVS
jgi:hypothetical protein